MAGQIAKINIPDDGGGNPTDGFLFDWPRGKMYAIGLYALRRYPIALETMSPEFTLLNTETAAFMGGGDIDPLTGNLIMQRTVGAGLTNGQPINRIDQNTFAVTGSFGGTTSFPSWPTSVWFGESLVCLTCGTLASGGASQVCYALLKYSEFSGAVVAIRVDTMQQAGFAENVIDDSVNNRGFLIRGASGPTGASAFVMGSNYASTGSTSVPLHCITIAPGAETYNSASWPATNPFIHQHLVANILPTAIDPSWTNIQPNSLGYDQTDGNVLLSVSSWGGTPSEYLVKINATTGAVMWATPHTNAAARQPALMGYQVGVGTVGMIGNVGYGLAPSDTGGPLTLGSISNMFLGQVGINNQGGLSIASDMAGLYLVNVGNYNSTTANAPAPVAGTPSTFSNSYAWIGGLFPAPPVITTLTDAELVFQPQIGFTDFTDEAVRRMFVSTGGTPAWMESDGGLPFGITPAVYLTTLGPPTDFAQNNGSGGAFAPHGTIWPATGPGCTPYFFVEAAGPEANPQWRLTVSDDGGRTWSRLVKPRSIGALGKYLTRLRWLKMGQSRERVVKLECTDRVRNNIVGIYIDLDQGMG